jgi:hypothetical protein
MAGDEDRVLHLCEVHATGPKHIECLSGFRGVHGVDAHGKYLIPGL